MLHRGQQLSAATARNDLAITEWRLSARSAGSDDVRDDSQPLDRADQAATARDGMCQLWMSLEGQPGEHGHHRNAHRLDTSIRHANVSHPTTKACLPRVEHVRFIPPCLRCRCRDCPAHPQTATRESQPEITPGWTQGGEAPSGAAPPPTTPNLPPQPEHTLLAGQSSRRSGGGRGDCHAAPGLANGSGTSLFQPRAVGPPMHIGAGRRSFRRTPSNAAWLTVLGRAPHAASFTGSRASGCVVG